MKKVAGVYLKASNIKSEETDRILRVINKNEKWKKELEKLEMEMNNKENKCSDGKDQSNKYNRDGEENGREFRKKMETIR